MKLLGDLDRRAVAIAKECHASRFIEAGWIAANTVELIKAELRRAEDKSEAEVNDLFVRAVFFRALFDFALLGHVTKQPHWDEDNNVLDFVWTKYWDCKERFDYARVAFGGLFVDFIAESLQRLRQYYDDRFGPGHYFSAEILIRRRLCSICGEDMRRCDHVPGRLYNGRLCQGIAVDVEPAGASLVENPHDPRCRIWPWNIDAAARTITAPVLTVHRLDDFSDSDRWVEESPKLRVKVALFNHDLVNAFFQGIGERRVLTEITDMPRDGDECG